jgi:DNA-binding IclR family transcriptional regulator
VNNFSAEVKQVIAALAHSEYAMSLREFICQTGFTPEQVYQTLQFLVQIRIFDADNSFSKNAIGEIVYSFASNDLSQQMYALNS